MKRGDIVQRMGWYFGVTLRGSPNKDRGPRGLASEPQVGENPIAYTPTG